MVSATPPSTPHEEVVNRLDNAKASRCDRGNGYGDETTADVDKMSIGELKARVRFLEARSSIEISPKIHFGHEGAPKTSQPAQTKPSMLSTKRAASSDFEDDRLDPKRQRTQQNVPAKGTCGVI